MGKIYTNYLAATARRVHDCAIWVCAVDRGVLTEARYQFTAREWTL